MNLNLKCRIVRLGLKQKDIAEIISTNGRKVYPSEVNKAISGKECYPKSQAICNDIANLLTRLERERGLDE